MRIAYVTTVFPVRSETFVGTEVRVLRRHGLDVSVDALGPPPGDESAILSEWGLSDVRVTHGGPGNVLRGLFTCVVRPNLVVSLLRLMFGSRLWQQPKHLIASLLLIPRTVQLFSRLERDPPDVVHLYWGHYPALLGHLLLERLDQTVLSISLAAYDLTVGYRCSGPVAARADWVRTWGKVNVPSIRAMGVDSERIQVVYQGFDFERFGEFETSDKVQRRIVSVARLIPAKGMDDVLEVFRRVKDRWPDATLAILGDGPERKSLEELAERLGIAESVDFFGEASHQTVLREMAAAEVFLLMSRHPHERLPNVVKEALAMRCMVVTTATPGIDELLRHGESGFVVPLRDVAGAAECLNGVFASAETTAGIQDRGYRHLQETFSSDVVATQLEGLWREQARRRRSRLEDSK